MYNPNDYIVEKFVLNEDVEVLKSTVDLAGSPGGLQVFSTEIEGTSTITTMPKYQ